MRSTSIVIGLILLLMLSAPALQAKDDSNAEPKWSCNMTNVEACSCPMFCQCYFTGAPALHADAGNAAMQYCRFNNAFKINKGNWGDASLDGVKFWMAGDLGGDFSKPPLWIVLTFEPSASPQQRDAVKAIVAHIFMFSDPGIIKTAADAKIDWDVNDQTASAKLDDGKAAEIELKKSDGADGNAVVIKNIKFWAAPRNDGFIMMPNTIEAYRLGSAPFEYKGTNGFVVTIDMNSDDLKHN